jgi:hypothetical protein
MAAFDPLRLVTVLVEHGVDFIVIGQVAAVMQGHPETTVDLDILPRQDIDNAERLVEALLSLDAHHLLSDSETEPIPPDERDFIGWQTVRRYETAAGRLDVIPSTLGVGAYDDYRSHAVTIDLDDFQVLAASLDAIIASKEATGRPKDRRRLPSLQAFRQQVRARGGAPDNG